MALQLFSMHVYKNMGKEYIVRGVPSPLIERFWHFAEPYVKRALDHAYGEMSFEDVRNRCINRDMQLWLVYVDGRVIGAGTTEIINYPQKKICRIVTLAGTEFDEWRQMAHNIIEMWAVENECVGMESLTRKGFVPKLLGMGYKHKYSVMHKSLKE